jgi:Na+-transporting NADH:ubiquinone oxidoreductase subunit A
LVPDDFTGITPKVVVKEQEYVMAGGPLFIDKNHPEPTSRIQALSQT